MSRAQFDRDEIIDKSIELFWQNGFHGSSMQRVVQSTGLKPGSIYLAFGNKEALYREALERYAKKSIARISSVLENAESVGHGVIEILERIIHDSVSTRYSSCFLVKAQLELAAEGGELHRFASEKLQEIEGVYRNFLEREYDQPTSKQRAVSIMLHIYGMRVYGYHHGAAERMRLGLKEGLPWLPWQER